jgi:hypothetical protein
MFTRVLLRLSRRIASSEVIRKHAAIVSYRRTLTSFENRVAGPSDKNNGTSTLSISTSPIEGEGRVPTDILGRVHNKLGSCCGCGTRFQTNNDSEAGYLPPHVVSRAVNEVLDRRSIAGGDLGDSEIQSAANDALSSVVCMRCHQLTFRGSAIGSMRNVVADDFRHLVQAHLLGDEVRRSAVVAIVDLTRFEETLISDLPDLVGSHPVLLVANKFDLLPRNAVRERVRVWAKRRAKTKGIVRKLNAQNLA